MKAVPEKKMRFIHLIRISQVTEPFELYGLHCTCTSEYRYCGENLSRHVCCREALNLKSHRGKSLKGLCLNNTLGSFSQAQLALESLILIALLCSKALSQL